jgi:hypothetical protein
VPRHNSRGIGRVSYLLISVYALLIVAALVSLKIGAFTGGTNTIPTTTLPPTSIGADGVQSRVIMDENALPGTTTWRISSNTSTTAIQGYANATNAQIGQNIVLYVNTKLPSYYIQAFRMGWYQGKGARLIWTSQRQRGIDQPACPVDHNINMVSCYNWKISAVMLVSEKFVQGDYLLKLVGSDGSSSYIPLTVWDPTGTSTYVVVNRSIIEQGWNAYGGYSFYAGTGPCIVDNSSYPVCNRARIVSFDRPYDTGNGSSDFLTNEYPLVALMEKEGLDVSYITDVTLASYPNVLAHHKVLISLDHDESWTYEERLALQTAQAHGLNAIFLGAAAMVRHVRLEPSILGLNRQVVDYRNSYEDPLNGKAPGGQVTGNTWESPPASWSPLPQIGVQYSGFLAPNVFVPMVVSDANSWVFHGTGLVNGSSLVNVVASDFDHVIPSPAEPANLEVLSHSPVPVSEGTANGGIWNGNSYSDMVYFTNPVSHAGTIDTGNNVWVGDLNRCTTATYPTCPAPQLIDITNNILRLFGKGPSGLIEPSVSNLSSIIPAGS